MKNYLSDWDPELQAEASIEALTKAVELGVSYFDTAPLYGRGLSEQLFGRSLKPHRDQVFLATQVRESSPPRSVGLCASRYAPDRLGRIQCGRLWWSISSHRYRWSISQVL